MKKYLYLLAFMLLCVTNNVYSKQKQNFGETLATATGQVYADGKSVIDTLYQDGKAVVQTVYGDVKSSATALYPDIKRAVVQIANGIGVAAEHVYIVLVKKFLVDGVVQLSLLVLSIIMIIFGCRWWNKKTSNDGPITYKVIPGVILLLAGIITAITVNYDVLFMGIINPEYGAINYILDYSKSLI